MPAGFEYQAQFEAAGHGEDGAACYQLATAATNLRGIYKLQGSRLTLTIPVEAKMAGLAWEIKNKNVIVLTEHPESANVGTDYRNATLSRGIPKCEAQDESGVVAPNSSGARK